MTDNHQDFKGRQCLLVPTGKIKLHLYMKKEGRELKKSQENLLFKPFHHRNKVVVQK